MRFTILHISDLHRDPEDAINNKWLLDSLEKDFAQFEQQEPQIQKPTLCIVSGDLIYGAQPGAGAEKQEQQQYEQALEFLICLADRFFEGRRERIVLLPGNHDVSYQAVVASAQQIPNPTDAKKKAELVTEHFRPYTRLRWSWRDLCFYRIVDPHRYESRFQNFASTYEKFYKKKKAFSLEPANQFDVFDYPDMGFCVVALNSCFNNDPIRRAGGFEPTALTSVGRKLREAERTGWLVAAAWHHNVSGGPALDDYLDTQFLQLLIDSGVSLGFHGHQHMAECFDERYRIGPSLRKITIISASTLCASPHNLKPGQPRSYNIVELDTDNWTGRVHQRQMINLLFNLPVWGPGHFTSSNRSFFDFEVCKPVAERPRHLDLQILLDQADRNLGARRWKEGVEILERVKDQPLARTMLLKGLSELGDPRRIITSLWPPQTIPEMVTLGGAILDAGTREEAEAYVSLPFALVCKDASVLDMSQRIKERRLR